MDTFSFLDDIEVSSEDDGKGRSNGTHDCVSEDTPTRPQLSAGCHGNCDFGYSPRTNLLGDSPTESTGSYKAPIPQNRTVLALKDESRREGKELRKASLP